jgi:hypothetical protein
LLKVGIASNEAVFLLAAPHLEAFFYAGSQLTCRDISQGPTYLNGKPVLGISRTINAVAMLRKASLKVRGHPNIEPIIGTPKDVDRPTPLRTLKDEGNGDTGIHDSLLAKVWEYFRDRER